MVFAGKKAPLEEDQVKGTAGDAAVSKIEDRGEEAERVAAYQRHPFREGGVDNREIKHVNHTAEHERGIVPDQAVEETVYDIAHSSGRNHSETYSDPGRCIGFLQKAGNPVRQKAEEDNPEKGQEEFPHCAAELHAERHSFILNEIDLEPVTKDMDALSYRHVCLHEYLYDLVNDHQKDSENNEFLSS